MKPISQLNKSETKLLILSRFGMLECGINFKNKLSPTCTQCNSIDDENHRLNECPKWKRINYSEKAEKADFSDIFSNDCETVKNILLKIQTVWNATTENGTMRST